MRILILALFLTSCADYNTVLLPEKESPLTAGCKIVSANANTILNSVDAAGVGVKCSEKLPEKFCFKYNNLGSNISVGCQ